MSRRASAARSRGTVTSSFGVSRREGHDSGDFYSRFASPVLSADAEINQIAPALANRVICRDSRAMPEVPDSSVGLVVTSPPYFAGKEYEQDLAAGHVPASYLEYLAMLEDVFAECVRKLEPGGRIAVNVANLGRKPYRSLSADVIAILQDKLRLLLRGEVIWQKALGSAGSCAWGSFLRPSNPVLRDVTERVVIASKGRFSRALSQAERNAAHLPCVPSLSKDEFMEATVDVWNIPSESATRIGHPAPFPVALPLRLIHLYTYRDDLVLDPFMGAGTTAVAASRSGRRFVGYETEQSYIDLCYERLAAEGQPGAQWYEGRQVAGSVREYAETLLTKSGFRSLESDVAIQSGLVVSFRAYDLAGSPWLFDVVGSFSASGAAGLKRADTLWKTLGKAAVVHEASPRVRFVLLATSVPAGTMPGSLALAALCGADKPIHAVIELTSQAGHHRLKSLAREA